MSNWHPLYSSADLAPEQVVEVSHGEEDLLLWREQNGECRIATAYCPHQRNYIPNGLQLGEGLHDLLQDDELYCPYHGWRFNAQGQCTHVPQGQAVPPEVRAGYPVLRRWRVRENNGQIEIGTEVERNRKGSGQGAG